MAHVMGGITWALDSNLTRAFNASGQVGNPEATTSSTNSTAGAGTSTSTSASSSASGSTSR